MTECAHILRVDQLDVDVLISKQSYGRLCRNAANSSEATRETTGSHHGLATSSSTMLGTRLNDLTHQVLTINRVAFLDQQTGDGTGVRRGNDHLL